MSDSDSNSHSHSHSKLSKESINGGSGWRLLGFLGQEMEWNDGSATGCRRQMGLLLLLSLQIGWMDGELVQRIEVEIDPFFS